MFLLKECVRLFKYKFYMFSKCVFCEKETNVLTELSLTYLNCHVVEERCKRLAQ